MKRVIFLVSVFAVAFGAKAQNVVLSEQVSGTTVKLENPATNTNPFASAGAFDYIQKQSAGNFNKWYLSGDCAKERFLTIEKIEEKGNRVARVVVDDTCTKAEDVQLNVIFSGVNGQTTRYDYTIEFEVMYVGDSSSTTITSTVDNYIDECDRTSVTQHNKWPKSDDISIEKVVTRDSLITEETIVKDPITGKDSTITVIIDTITFTDTLIFTKTFEPQTQTDNITKGKFTKVTLKGKARNALGLQINCGEKAGVLYFSNIKVTFDPYYYSNFDDDPEPDYYNIDKEKATNKKRINHRFYYDLESVFTMTNSNNKKTYDYFSIHCAFVNFDSQKQTVTNGIVTDPAPTRDCYMFKGWKLNKTDDISLTPNTDKDGNLFYSFDGWKFDEDLMVVSFSPLASNDISFVSEWIPLVVFDSNGGSDVEDQVVVNGTIKELPKPVRKGYDFVGWKLNATSLKENGEGFLYDGWELNADTIVTKISTSITLGVKLVAQWANPTSVTEMAINAYVANEVLYISDAADVVIYDINGRVAKSAKNATSIIVSDLKSGLYVTKIGNKFIRFVK